LNHRNIQQFLRLNGFYATDNEIVAIIRRLDVDADQKITYDEWIEAVKPQPGSSLSSSSAGLTSSSFGASRFEEEKRTASPLRASQYERSPVRESLTSSQLGASRSPTRSYASPSKLGSSSYGERKSPLKADDEQELVRAFKEQIALEQELEDAKNRLAL
jgi:hypothetical protein